MSYAQVESLVKRYGANVISVLAPLPAQEGQINPPLAFEEQKVQEALNDASQTIDSYLTGRYALPLAVVPAVLERHCCYIARYFLEKNRATDQARQDYEDSLRFLEKVAAGVISLGLSTTGETVQTNNTAQIQSAGSVWSRERSQGFI